MSNEIFLNIVKSTFGKAQDDNKMHLERILKEMENKVDYLRKSSSEDKKLIEWKECFSSQDQAECIYFVTDISTRNLSKSEKEFFEKNKNRIFFKWDVDGETYYFTIFERSISKVTSIGISEFNVRSFLPVQKELMTTIEGLISNAVIYGINEGASLETKDKSQSKFKVRMENTKVDSELKNRFLNIADESFKNLTLKINAQIEKCLKNLDKYSYYTFSQHTSGEVHAKLKNHFLECGFREEDIVTKEIGGNVEYRLSLENFYVQKPTSL